MKDLEHPTPQGRHSAVARLASRLWARSGRRGNVIVTFALLAPVIVLLSGGLLDISSMVTAQIRLQDATDAAALAVSDNTAKNPNITEASLRIIAQSVLNTDYNGAGATLTDFHVCAPIQSDCTTGAGAAMTNETVYLAAQAQAPCYLGNLLPGVCTGGNVSRPIKISATSAIGYAMNVQINMLLDSSGSMIVGATTADVEAVEAWNNIPANWNTVKYSGEPAQGPPCAFACHSEGASTNNTTQADMQVGLTNAAAAGATTRFGVMISAAYKLVQHVQTEVSQSQQLAHNTYYFNVADFNGQQSNGQYVPTLDYASGANDFAGTEKAICSSPTYSPTCSSIKIGLNTHINEMMPLIAQEVGSSGSGTGASQPLKFLIIVTDGLESDFNQDFYGCTGATTDPAWAQSDKYSRWYTNNPYYGSASILTGCFAKPFDPTQCTTMKNNGIVLAVLETPYVRLDRDPTLAFNAQNPAYFPMDTGEVLYESFVRHTIYPGGEGSASTVSTALQSCASSGYYFQANSPTDIATGFTTLTDKFLSNLNYLQK